MEEETTEIPCMFELTKRCYFDMEAQLTEQGRYDFQHATSLFKTQLLILPRECSEVFIEDYLMAGCIVHHQRH